MIYFLTGAKLELVNLIFKREFFGGFQNFEGKEGVREILNIFNAI